MNDQARIDNTRGKGAFASIGFYWMAVAGWAGPTGWLAAIYFSGGIPSGPVAGNTPLQLFVSRYFLILFWLLMFPIGCYYFHLLFFRLRVSLGIFLTLLLVWGNATAFTWSAGGWEPGLTVASIWGTVLLYGAVWGLSVARFLEVEHLAARIGLIALGVFRPFSWLLIPAHLWVAWSSYTHYSHGLMTVALGVALGMSALLVFTFKVSGQASKAAHALLARA